MGVFKTYRFELVAMTMLVSALSLGLFGVISWNLIHDEKLNQVDLTLQSAAGRFGGRLFSRLHQPGPLANRMSSDMINRDDVFEEQLDTLNLGVIVVGRDGDVKWQNERWDESCAWNHYIQYATDPPERRSGVRNLPPRRPLGHDLERPTQDSHKDGSLRRERPPHQALMGNGPPPQGMGAPDRLINYDSAFFETVKNGSKRLRIMVLPVANGVILFQKSKDQVSEEMKDTTRAYLLALPFSVLLAGLGALYLAKRALDPVTKLSESAQSITIGDLGRRIKSEGERVEFADLINVYNAMLDRLQKSFGQAKRFSADAAHELNTPLTILHGYLDDAIQSSEVGSPDQERYVMLLEEVTMLRDLVEKLLMLSRADSGKLKIVSDPFDLSSLVAGVVEDAEIMAEHLTFESTLVPALMVHGDKNLLRQLILNLLSNAIKYNRDDGRVSIVLDQSDGRVFLRMTNTGFAIPSGEVDRLFERFFRADPSRNRARQGLGLGLSLAQEIVNAHDGSLRLVENTEDSITFEMEIPV